MPSLCSSSYSAKWVKFMKVEVGQIISQILSFLIMLWILKRYAWKPILKFMDDRQSNIKSQFDEIEDQKKQLSSQIKEYNEKLSALDAKAHSKIREAVETGQQMAQKIQQDALSQARSVIAKAELDAQKELHRAKVHLKNELVNLVLATTEKIFKADLNQEKQKKLIVDFVKQMEID